MLSTSQPPNDAQRILRAAGNPAVSPLFLTCVINNPYSCFVFSKNMECARCDIVKEKMTFVRALLIFNRPGLSSVWENWGRASP
jgi:hypothetical protein